MPFYRVQLRGYNFPGHRLGRPEIRFGLYTVRWVQALNPKRAELKAVAIAWSDPKLSIPSPKRPEDRAWLKVEEIQKVDKLPLFRGGGATWFEE